MDGERPELCCHQCNSRQRDRKAYRDHLLKVHGQVARRGVGMPVKLRDRELAVVIEGVLRRQKERRDRVTQRRVELRTPRISDRETPRRLHDNEVRTERQHRSKLRDPLKPLPPSLI